MNSSNPIRSRIQHTIMELCSEDDWGGWELWWNVEASNSSENQTEVKCDFISVIEEMVNNGKLLSKRHLPEGICVKEVFDVRRLASELDRLKNVDADSFYWFGTR